jgi:hypothetical protein
MIVDKDIKIKERPNESDDYCSVIEVYYKNELVFEWYDNANSDYPEDLCWSRMIADVFFSGVELGKKIR